MQQKYMRFLKLFFESDALRYFDRFFNAHFRLQRQKATVGDPSDGDG
jgi:hypothetical protein